MMAAKTLTPAEAAPKLGLALPTVYVYCQQGRLGEMVDGRYRITREELREFARIPRKPGWPRGKPRKLSHSPSVQ